MQIAHTQTIVSVGVRMQVPHRALVVAIVAALQESSLRNLANPVYPDSLQMTTEGLGTDHDSVGLFQQRPSTGWGSVADLMRPEIAAERFYRALLAVPGWQHLDVAAAAQAVQISAYPRAFERHVPLADFIVAVSVPTARTGCVPILAGPWIAPVTAPLVSGFRTPQRPTHDGVDLAAPRGTPIRAAGHGVVTTAACNSSTGDCDRDGSPQVRGCGWYVEIEHAGGVMTRYCHMLFRPDVKVGDHVSAGGIIGRIGSSGQSSGPHLHFEVHIAGMYGRTPVDPLGWMSRHGVPIG